MAIQIKDQLLEEEHSVAVQIKEPLEIIIPKTITNRIQTQVLLEYSLRTMGLLEELPRITIIVPSEVVPKTMEVIFLRITINPLEVGLLIDLLSAQEAKITTMVLVTISLDFHLVKIMEHYSAINQEICSHRMEAIILKP